MGCYIARRAYRRENGTDAPGFAYLLGLGRRVRYFAGCHLHSVHYLYFQLLISFVCVCMCLCTSRNSFLNSFLLYHSHSTQAQFDFHDVSAFGTLGRLSPRASILFFLYMCCLFSGPCRKPLATRVPGTARCLSPKRCDQARCGVVHG